MSDLGLKGKVLFLPRVTRYCMFYVSDCHMCLMDPARVFYCLHLKVEKKIKTQGETEQQIRSHSVGPHLVLSSDLAVSRVHRRNT